MENMNINTSTIVRTIVSAVVMLNAVLVMVGKTPLELDENIIYTVVSGIATIADAIWIWWKNNSFTKKAIMADEYKKSIK